jgi:predicted 3-demethylubiquinone-9 3-methyltransferase (glyoxalase superfamily)
MSNKVYPCLWFDKNAEEAARFYVSVLPDSRIDGVYRSPADNPSGKEGDVLIVDFTVAGQKLQGLNGGPDFRFSEAISLVIECEDQAEVDGLWEKLTKDGGEPGPCGWLKDKYGVSWQVIPDGLIEMISDPDPVKSSRTTKAMYAMGKLDVAALKKAYDGV